MSGSPHETDRAVGQGHSLATALLTWVGVAVHLACWLLVSAFLTVTWVFLRGPFWPSFPMASFGLLVALHAGVTLVLGGGRAARSDHARLGLQLHTVGSGAVVTYLWVLHLLTRGATRGQTVPWPVWPTMAGVLLMGIHALAVLFFARTRRYDRRIAELTSRRSGVVAAQAVELRRIERDLHDGAQARLVAVNLQLGLLQQQLATSPDAVRDLLAEAKGNTVTALRELRDLARGIYPPVLGDRGLVAAVSSLAAASSLPVTVESTLAERPPAALEAALYFVAAEALSNAIKHGCATSATVVIERSRHDLVLTVTDDGRGGADPRGGGLTGIRQRVEAFDGRLDVSSPAGGPTVVRAEVPCAS